MSEIEDLRKRLEALEEEVRQLKQAQPPLGIYTQMTSVRAVQQSHTLQLDEIIRLLTGNPPTQGALIERPDPSQPPSPMRGYLIDEPQ